VALHEPRLGRTRAEFVLDCIDTNWVSSAGKYVDRFEQMVAAGDRGRLTPSPSSNGIRPLHAGRCCFEGVKPNDEVIVPSITFVATRGTPSAIAGAFPHFVDSSPGIRWGWTRRRWRRTLRRYRSGGTANW